MSNSDKRAAENVVKTIFLPAEDSSFLSCKPSDDLSVFGNEKCATIKNSVKITD